MNILRHRIRKQGGYTLKSDGTWSTREESSPRP